MECVRCRVITVTVLASAICTWLAQVGMCDEPVLQDAILSIRTEIRKLDSEIGTMQSKRSAVTEKMNDLIRQMKEATGQVGGSTGDLKLESELASLKLILSDCDSRLRELRRARADAAVQLSKLEQMLLGPQPEPPDYE